MATHPRLEPCPFCQTTELYIDQFSTDPQNGEFRVCHSAADDPCGAWGPEKPTRDEAVAAWNTRASTTVTSAAKEQADALETALGGGITANIKSEGIATTSAEVLQLRNSIAKLQGEIQKVAQLRPYTGNAAELEELLETATRAIFLQHRAAPQEMTADEFIELCKKHQSIDWKTAVSDARAVLNATLPLAIAAERDRCAEITFNEYLAATADDEDENNTDLVSRFKSQGAADAAKRIRTAIQAGWKS